MSPSAISGGVAWEALDSRGNPTVGCELRLRSGFSGSAIVPAGASTGRFEACELRDGGRRFGGRGVRQAVANVNSVLLPALIGRAPADQASLDEALCELDGTPNLDRLGANAVLGVSLAWAIAQAAEQRMELYEWAADGTEILLPLPMVSIVSGGAHAGGALDLQDVLAVPLRASSFTEAIEHIWRVRSSAFAIAAERGLPAALVADEGGLGVPLPSNRAALELMNSAIERAGLLPGTDIGIAIDLAANQLEVEGGYRLGIEECVLDAEALVAELAEWCAAFPIVSVEDPLHDSDWRGWTHASERLDGIQLVGDDLFATNLHRLADGVARNVANAILIKPNQAGTLSRAFAVSRAAQADGYATVLSARSGDTEDSWLADLAVGWAVGQIKVGSLARSERTAKWNRLLHIEALEESVRYAGAAPLKIPENKELP
jgi:enolase 1/2/3